MYNDYYLKIVIGFKKKNKNKKRKKKELNLETVNYVS